MVKYAITFEENAAGGSVQVRLLGAAPHASRAGRLALQTLQRLQLIAGLPDTDPPCPCECCQAMLEKRLLNPTLH